MAAVAVEVGLQRWSVMRWCPSSRVGGPVAVEVGLGRLSVMRWCPSSPLRGQGGWAWRCELGSGRYPVEVGLAGLSLMR